MSSVEHVAERELTPEGERRSPRRRFLMRYLRPRLGAAVALWRFEAHTVTPMALLFIATLGRWPGALATGSVMAVYSAIFLFLLQDEVALEDVRAWAARRRIGRAVERLATRDDATGKAQRALAVFPAVMLLGPFWRAVTFHLFRMRRVPAYVASVAGSIPHSLLWVGLVLGSLWEVLILPLLKALWSDIVMPFADRISEALSILPGSF